MAHAEMTAMIKLKEKEHLNVNNYTLYIGKAYCSEGVFLAKQLYEEKYFENAISQKKSIDVIYDEVISKYN